MPSSPNNDGFIPDSAPVNDGFIPDIQPQSIPTSAIYNGAFQAVNNALPWNRIRSGLQTVGGNVAEEGGKLAAQVSNAGYPKTGNLIQGAGIGLGAIPALGPDVLASISGPEGEGISLPGSGIAKDVAQSAGRRALGFTKPILKSMINKTGSIDDANQAAQIMLDKGVIANPLTHPFSSGASSMLERAQDLGESSGKAIGSTISDLSSQGIPSIDTNAVGNEVLNQLSSPLSGGAYNQQNAIAGEIADTIGAHGNGPIDFNSAQDLKQKLGDLASFNKNTDNQRALMYQRAYGIVNNALSDSIEDALQNNPEGFQKYLQNKTTYGASELAQKGLTNRLAQDAGNRKVSLTDMIAGGAELAHGNPAAALSLVGLKHGLEEYGMSGTAVLANKLAQAKVPDSVRNLILLGYANSQNGTTTAQQ